MGNLKMVTILTSFVSPLPILKKEKERFQWLGLLKMF